MTTTTTNPIAAAYERACTDSLRAAMNQDDDGSRLFLSAADALEAAYPGVIADIHRQWGVEELP